MKVPSLLLAVQPFIAVAAVVSTASILVVAIYFTLLDLAWIAFLAGILFAGLLAMVSRATRAEYAAANRGAKLAISEENLTQETERAQRLEATLARANALLQFADESLPAMLAFTDAEGIYRYHNRAFRRWLDLPAHRIDGHHMPEVLGRLVYGQIEPAVLRARAGEAVRYERSHKIADGSSIRLNVQLLPVTGSNGTAGEFFSILTIVGENSRDHAINVASAPHPQGEAPALTEPGSALAGQAQFNNALVEHATGMQNARGRILAAIQHNEFLLFGQLIEPLDVTSGSPKCYEILIRLLEEENNMIAPGAFFPLAEENGLLPQLDRWVIANLLRWAAGRRGGPTDQVREVYFINIATATLCDAEFSDYVARQLQKHEFAAGGLCFEIAEIDLASHRGDVDEFVRTIKLLGCKVALSGFGRNRISVGELKELPLDYLKIDGSIVLQMFRDPVCMSKVVAINRIAKAVGITTIAEMVEDVATIASLRKIAVQYGQGFGIAAPRLLSEIA